MNLSENHRHGGGMGDGNKIPLSSIEGIIGSSVSTFIGQADCPSSTGTQTITGVGFKPSCVIFLSHKDKSFSVGYANGTADKTLYSQYDTNDMNIADYSVRVQNSSNAYSSATLQSTNSDGFVLNWNATASVVPFTYLCIK